MEGDLEQQILSDMKDAAVETLISRSKAAMERNVSRSIARIEAKKTAAAVKKQSLEELMSTPLEHIEAIIAKGNIAEGASVEEIEVATTFKESQEYKKALRDLETRKRQDKLLTASKFTEITPEQRTAAGYTHAPVGLAPPAAISVQELRSELMSRAVPIPRDFLKPGMFGYVDSVVFGVDGSNLLGGPMPDCVLKLEQKSISVDDTAGGEIIAQEQSVPYDAIISMKLAQELGIKREDIIVTPENQGEIKKYLSNNDHGLALVKPFSIQAGIAGYTKVNGKDALIAFDHPDLSTGQPGQLFAIVSDGTFRKAPTGTVVYNPNVDIDFSNGTIKNDTLALAQSAADMRIIADKYVKPSEVSALAHVTAPPEEPSSEPVVSSVGTEAPEQELDLAKVVMNLSFQVSKLLERVAALEVISNISNREGLRI